VLFFHIGGERDMIASLNDDEIEDRYFLLGRMEILSVLNELIHRRESVSVLFNNGSEFFVTTLLEASHDELVFDLSGDARANQRLPESLRCVFVARLNGIRVQFAVGQAQRFSWGGSDAFRVPLPERVVRLQRRESYRLLLPVVRPLMATFFSAGDIVLGEWPAHNLSVGGLAITVSGAPALTLSAEIARLQLPLPKQRTIDCAVAVHHTTLLSEQQGNALYRIGVSFSALPPAMGVTIQRYITQIEHERRKLGSGMTASGSR
jgi:flagellar brake protein